MPAVTDEIFEKYLQKAISEINDLGDEIGRAAGEGRVPVLGSGHPLADVFLLKHEPQPAEVQEGVAFFGRAGQAVLKSLQRLHVDPMAIYGTNALKFSGGDAEEARPWLARELHIVQPKLVVVMGEPALAFLNELEFPLADAVEPTLGELQRFTPTIQALHVPDIDQSLDEQPAKTKFWNAFKTLGPWWAELPPVLTWRAAAFVALAAAIGVYYGTHQQWFGLSLWWAIAWLCFLLIPAVFGLVYLALPLWRAPALWLLIAAIAFGALAVVLQWVGAGPVANFAKLAAMTAIGWCFLRFFEELSWVVLVALIVPWVDSYSVWRGPTKTIVTQKPEVFSALSFTFPVPGQDGGAKLGLPDLLFFALYLGASARFGLRTFWTWVGLTASLGGTMALATAFNVDGLPALPLLSLGFLLPNADLIWREVRPKLSRSR